MTNYQAGDLVLVDFPLTASGPGKVRPAMVILDTGDADLLLARVTTQSHASGFDVEIHDWQQAGLLAPSSVRLHKLATIAKSRIRRRLGAVSSADRKQIAAALKRIVLSW